MTSPSTVGYMFIEEFYSTMNTEPDKLYKFYNKHSTVSHAFENEVAHLARGQPEVKKLFLRERFLNKCTVLVSNIDCVESLEGGVVLQVTGEMSNGDLSHDFSQTFFLAPKNNSYFVLNDILRVHGELEEEAESTLEEPETKPAQVSAPAPKAVPAPVSKPNPGPQPVPVAVPTSVPASAHAAAAAAPVPVPVPSSASAPAAATNQSSTPTQKVYHSAYLKVAPGVDRNELRKALSVAGEVTHLQIEPEKSRAFVDFVDQNALDRALALKSVQAGAVKVWIEPRKRRNKPVK